MTRDKYFGMSLLAWGVLLVAVGAGAVKAQSPPPNKPGTAQAGPALEPKAIEILKASCARLAAAHSMSFTAEVTYESPSRLGMPLAYSTPPATLNSQ